MKLTLDVLVRAEDAGDRQEAADEVKEEVKEEAKAEVKAEVKEEFKEEDRVDLHPKHPRSTNPSNQQILFPGIVGRKATGLQLVR